MVGLIEKFASDISSMQHRELIAEMEMPSRFIIDRSKHGSKDISVCYAPFDYLNSDAKVVIVGITPGKQQMHNAMLELYKRLKAGASIEEASKAAKTFASFSGPMRSNLVSMLDYIGLNRKLELASTNELWGKATHLVNFTSALRYPVFVDGQNYSGQPDMTKNEMLCKQLLSFFREEVRTNPHAFYIPLGPKVTNACEFVVDKLRVDQHKLLSGLPHPSGANAERIAYFLGKKKREALSGKVNPQTIEASRAFLSKKLSEI